MSKKKKTIRMSSKSFPTRGDWDKARWNEFQKNKEDLLQDVFDAADAQGMSNEELAKSAGLHPSTVYALVNYTTLNPHFSTVWKLVRAVDAELALKLHRSQKQTRRKSA